MAAMNPVIEKILAHKWDEVRLAKLSMPEEALVEAAGKLGERRSLIGAIKEKKGAPAIIAEIKRATPSAVLRPVGFDPVAIARSYEAAGAAAVSVLTDARFFCGEPLYVPMVREAVSIPTLRKDFIVDTWQVAEAAALGADAVLLMALNSSDEELASLYNRTLKLGMEPLVEIHSKEEWERVRPLAPKLVGINNRDFTSDDLRVDTNVSADLISDLPDDVTVISESGISSAAEIRRLMDVGADGFLIGSAFMKEADPGAALSNLLHEAAGVRSRAERSRK